MKSIRNLFALILSMLVIAAVWTQPASADVDVYTTPGEHRVNGREWRTECEPYSATERCRTEIWATQVTQEEGVFKAGKGWYFNNLTYKAMPRQTWSGNPLAETGAWTATDGRQWRTECDTPLTGGNGCRSFAMVDQIESFQRSGVWHHRWVRREVFNNMVRFSHMNPVTPPSGPMPASIEDPALRSCIIDELGISESDPMTADKLAAVWSLTCEGVDVEKLDGMPTFPNLERLYLKHNKLTTLEGLPMLPKLGWLVLNNNDLSTLAGMPILPNLVNMNLSNNRLTDLADMPALPSLDQLNLYRNTQLSTLVGMPELPSLSFLSFDRNGLANLDGIPTLTGLETLRLERNGSVTDVTPLAGFVGLQDLFIEGTGVTDLSPLDQLVADGLTIHP